MTMSNEQPSTYFVQDRSSRQELERLVTQDAMFTAAMNGPLAEQEHPEQLQRVLDVGCGTGGWLIETARIYPSIATLVGVDISKSMLDYACSQAKAAQVETRVEFQVMDALRMLEFPDAYFDLANMRLALSFIRTWDWSKILQEFRRVLKPGGILRVSDTLGEATTSSPTVARLQALILQALEQAGHSFPEGLAVRLPQLLEAHRFDQVHVIRYEPRYAAGTPEGDLCIEDITRVFRTALPFMRKWVTVPDNYEELYQQALVEIHQSDFWGIWPILTVTGTRFP